MALLDKTQNGHHDDDGRLSEFIQQIDEVEAKPQPSNIERFHIEREFEEAEDEQRHAYEEKAELEALEPEKVAAESEHEASKAKELSEQCHKRAKAAATRQERDEEILRPHVRRPPDAKALKWGRWLLLLGGDVVGIAGAALLLGELPAYAFMQAVSAGVSAVTLGAVGREVRNLVSARQRAKPQDELSPAEFELASWFSGPNGTEKLTKILVLVCLAGLLLIAGGIFSLREMAEGPEAALAFGCLSLALGLASFYNSYDTADEVAEHLDAGQANVKKLQGEASAAAAAPAIKLHAGSLSEAKSIRTAMKAAGDAAAAGLRRTLYKVFGNSPGVVGHGTLAKRQNGKASSNGSHSRRPK